MQVAAEHELPARSGRQTRIIRGGLQENYLKAVRDYLTDASLSHQRAPEAAVESGMAPIQTDELTVQAASIHGSAQGRCAQRTSMH
eukprot:6459834-Amphidinium_carterae.3